MKEFTKEQEEEINNMDLDKVKAWYEECYGDVAKPPYDDFFHKALYYCSTHYPCPLRDDLVLPWVDMNDKKQIRDIKEILDFLFEIYSRDKNKNRRAIGLINTLSEELLEFQNDTYWKTDTER